MSAYENITKIGEDYLSETDSDFMTRFMGGIMIPGDFILECTVGKRADAENEFDTVQHLVGEFPPVAIAMILRKGFQRLFNDPFGAATMTLAAKISSRDEMIARYANGDVGRVNRVSRVDEMTREIRKLVARALRSKMPNVWKKIKDEDDLGERLDAIFEKQSETRKEELQTQARAAIEAKRKQNAASDSIDVSAVEI